MAEVVWGKSRSSGKDQPHATSLLWLPHSSKANYFFLKSNEAFQVAQSQLMPAVLCWDSGSGKRHLPPGRAEVAGAEH